MEVAHAQTGPSQAPTEPALGGRRDLPAHADGFLYLASIIDLFSRRVVGWALSAVNDRRVVLRALDMAVRRRRPGHGLLHHSDRGNTYASDDDQDALTAIGVTCSMSRRANCLDNAAMESWHGT